MELKTLTINEDEKIQMINLKRLIERRYKPTITNQIRWFFKSVIEVTIILFIIPFLALIKIFQIIFNRK